MCNHLVQCPSVSYIWLVTTLPYVNHWSVRPFLGRSVASVYHSNRFRLLGWPYLPFGNNYPGIHNLPMTKLSRNTFSRSCSPIAADQKRILHSWWGMRIAIEYVFSPHLWAWSVYVSLLSWVLSVHLKLRTCNSISGFVRPLVRKYRVDKGKKLTF